MWSDFLGGSWSVIFIAVLVISWLDLGVFVAGQICF